MRKFKHITGATAVRMTEKINHIHKYASTEFGYIHPDLVENSAEWEEIVEPKRDYEILSFKTDMSTWSRCEDNLFRRSKTSQQAYSEETHLKHKDSIYRVKRLSDGETFTIGDNICHLESDWKLAKVTIDKFEIKKNSIDIHCTQYKNSEGIDIGAVKGSYNLKQLKVKVVKKPLFTTEDGVEIFKDDRSYGVTKNFDYIGIFSWKSDLVFSDASLQRGVKYFSTKEKAEEYILINKTCLSLNEVCLEIQRKSLHISEKNKIMNALTELVKSKL